MNILFIIDSLTGGGAEKVTSVLANQISHDQKNKVYVLVDERKQNEYALDSRVTLLSIDRKHYRNKVLNIWQKIRKYIIVKKIKKNNNIQCSIGMLPIACFYNTIAKGNEKIINSIRIKLSASDYPQYIIQMMRYAVKKADLNVAVSECVRRDVLTMFGLENKRIVTVYNPCDIETINELKNQNVEADFEKKVSEWEYVFATHGRLSLQKGQWHLIRIVKSLRAKGINVGIFILGEGELREQFVDMINQLGLQDNVLLLGRKNNPYKYLNKADIYLFSSLYEGFPNALLDAMALGLPIISSDGESGIRELLAPDTDCDDKTKSVEYAEFGVIVSRFSSEIAFEGELDYDEENMEEAIINMINSPDVLEHYKRKSSERITDYSYNKIITDWTDAIESLK